MEINNFVHTVSRIFPSSLTSCQFRTLSDTIQPSMNNPKTCQNLHEDQSFHSRKSPKNDYNNPKKTQFLGSDISGRRCHLKGKDKESSKNVIAHSSSSNGGWFSDEKTETNTFFSLSSIGSCESFTESSKRTDNIVLSTGRHCRKTTSCKPVQKINKNPVKSASEGPKTRNKTRKNELIKPKQIVPEVVFEFSDVSTEIYYGNAPTNSRKTRKKVDPGRRKANSIRPVDGWIEESYAMEKCSMDPRSDFRASMVEMIVEKQIFGGIDLERLLHCFLSLNEASYHGIIFDVFKEICATLFSN